MIGSAVQKGNEVYVYNLNGGLMWANSGTLLGFTSHTVTIKRGSITYVYGERGELKFSR